MSLFGVFRKMVSVVLFTGSGLWKLLDLLWRILGLLLRYRRGIVLSEECNEDEAENEESQDGRGED